MMVCRHVLVALVLLAAGCSGGNDANLLGQMTCDGIGQSGCSGAKRLVCERGDDNYVWAEVTECKIGCLDGQCIAGAGYCENECPIDARGCTGNTAVVCAWGDGCWVWTKIDECSQGCVDGGCVGTSLCRDDCPGEGVRECDGDGVRLCARTDACLHWTFLTDCSNGCTDGYCNGGNGCEDQCPGDGSLDCRDDVLIRCTPLDGCLGWTDVQTCPQGCTDGHCVEECVPNCDGRQCGDNGCGGDCGSCDNGASCVDHQCQGGCTPNSWTDCCGSNVCWYNSCGQQGNVTAYCESGCEGGQCRGCTPNCTNRQCGDNGCGGSCGSCSGGAVCQSNQCVCTANAWKACCGQNVCWFDSCGNQTSTDSTCPYGCSAGVCNNCTPQCGGKQCGSNGCGGTCGTCGGGQTCTTSGQCQGTTGAKTVTGLLTYDARFPRADGSRIVLDQVQTLPAIGAVVIVADSGGNLLGMAQADGEGRYSVGLTKALVGGEKVVFSTLWSPSLDDPGPVLAVLHPPYGGSTGTRTSPPWSWWTDIPLNGQVGELHVTEAQGSGALYLLLYNIGAMAEVIDFLLGGQTSSVATLALLWAPNTAWDCGCCFSSGTSQTVANGGGGFSQTIFIGGETDGPSAWGYPVVLHEFGHYLAKNYSRDNSPGGYHEYGQLLIPRFAWSEGWASFFAVSTMSRWIGEAAPLMWDIQGGSSFWINYDGAASTSGGYPVAPNPDAGITQSLDETWVSTMLWHLWDGYDVAEIAGSEDGTALGSAAILSAIRSNRFRYSDRGASGADFVDFADAAVCENSGIGSSFETTVRSFLGFPYLVSDATCY